MNTKKLIVICSIGIIVILSILFGIDHFEFNFHKGDMSYDISSIWNTTKSISSTNGSIEAISEPTIPVIVVYKNTIVGDTAMPNSIKIDISDKYLGLFWIPIFKTSSYNFSINCQEEYEIKTKTSIQQTSINGEIFVSGKYNYIGTTKSVTKTVVEDLLKGIYKEVKSELNKRNNEAANAVWKNSSEIKETKDQEQAFSSTTM